MRKLPGDLLKEFQNILPELWPLLKNKHMVGIQFIVHNISFAGSRDSEEFHLNYQEKYGCYEDNSES